MAYPATNRFNYWGQLGVLAGLIAGGIVIAFAINYLSVLSLVGSDFLKYSEDALQKKLLVPQNANSLRLVQFLSTFFIFFLPSVLYARYCHVKPLMNLGADKRVTWLQAGVVILIMASALPFVGIISDLIEKLPFSKATFDKFKAAEDAYDEQVAVIARMNSFGDYIVSLLVMAVLPALFEETLFRGSLQNLLSRWWKMPILAVVITSAVFSYVHGSYFGFLSRFVLGFVLGWMYHRTGNLWLSIIAHAFNNGIGLTFMYLSAKSDSHFPAWMGLASMVVVYGLFILFEKVSAYQISEPGKEILIPVENPDQPSWLHSSPPNQLIFTNGI